MAGKAITIKGVLMFKVAFNIVLCAALAAIGTFQYLIWKEVSAAKRAALYGIVKAEEAGHSAGLASDRAGIACRASLEAIGKLPKGATIWETPTVESSMKSGFCGGADLDNL
ncbi:hypothetical protein [uncultured Sphingobium sp.]|uniref:hypothetical protein n=1 Tax=uncultured Sphingobium sp. TaxID=316087 RepID=UPI00259B49F9|nr:hypothetical protein [uncultured Sphingobium sp.]